MTYISKILLVLTTIAIGIFSILILATLNGTLIWIIWPKVIPVVFPVAVASGVIPANLSWGVSVGLSWLTAILFGKVVYNGDKK